MNCLLKEEYSTTDEVLAQPKPKPSSPVRLLDQLELAGNRGQRTIHAIKIQVGDSEKLQGKWPGFFK